MLRLMLWFSLAVVSACDGLVEPIGPVPMEPGPAQYSAQAQIADCAGVNVPMSSVAWYTVDALRGYPDGVGAWNRPNFIYLRKDYADDIKVSAHELVHHILRGDPWHRSGVWETCGVWP